MLYLAQSYLEKKNLKCYLMLCNDNGRYITLKKSSLIARSRSP